MPGLAAQTNLPFISVVVPVYNGAGAIRACIEALLGQDYPLARREIIIVDNNSTDDTAAIVAGYPVTLLHERSVKTSYAARNTGIRNAVGEIVAFTDADCLPQADWLTHLAQGFRTPDVVGLAGRLQPVEPVGLVDAFLAKRSPVRSQRIGGGWYVVTANAAYRRNILLRLGMFDQRLSTGGDIDLSLRIQASGSGRIEAAPGAIVNHQFENSWRSLWVRYRRYGYAQHLIGALFAGQTVGAPTAGEQRRRTLRQLRSLLIYPLSFLWRFHKVPSAGWNPSYNLAPILSLTAEAANLWGQFRADLDIRWRRDRLPEPRRFPTNDAPGKDVRRSEA